MKQLSVFLCVACLCNLIQGFHIDKSFERKFHRIPRSPVTYVADEGGHRVIIFTLKTPGDQPSILSPNLGPENNDKKPTYGSPAFGHGPVQSSLSPVGSGNPSNFGSPTNYRPLNNNNYNTQGSNKFNYQPNQIGLSDYHSNSPSLSEMFNPSQAPGALKIIELLRTLGIPGLPDAPYIPPPVLSGASGGSLSGGDSGPVGSPGFGADLSGGLLGGGFGMNRPNIERPNNQ